MRLKLLKSGLPRLVVRRANDNIHAQIIRYEPSGDITLAEEISGNLRKLGWRGHCGNLPAAYLTGMLIGVKALKAGVSEAVLDSGLQMSTKGNSIYALVKGAKDAGLEIPVGEEILPDESRIKGEHIQKWAEKLKGTPKFAKQFGKSDAAETVKNFEEVKAKILGKK